MTNLIVCVRQRRRCFALPLGHTFVELMLALGLGSIVLAGLASVLVITETTADLPSQSQAVVDATQICYDLLDELQDAIFIGEHGPHIIEFVVPDRMGDGNDDLIRYDWTGVSGDSLQRTLNNGTPTLVSENVHQFNITPQITKEICSVPHVTNSGELLLAQHPPNSFMVPINLTPRDWIGQIISPKRFLPTIPTEAVD